MPILAAAAAWRLVLPICLLGLVLSGCAKAPEEETRLASAIRQHYAAHASEEEGACSTPKIDTIQEQRQVETSAGGEEVVQVRYSYFDPNVDMDARFDRLVHLSQPCGGIAERRFVLARSDVGYRVTAMSGERRDGESAR